MFIDKLIFSQKNGYITLLMPLKRYPDKIVRLIRLYRQKNGISYRQLSNRFNVPTGTIRNWCHQDGISRKDSLLKANQILRNNIKKSETDCVPINKNLTVAMSRFIAGLLYGCEGSKYPSSSAMLFTNSDPELITTFYKLLFKGFKLDKNRLSLHLQIHSDQNYSELQKFWSKKIGVDRIRFIKPTITSPKGKKHRAIYKGTCTLRYYDFRLQLKLLGIYEKFIGIST